MLQVQATIGRNVGAEPMSADRWQAFQDDVLAALKVHTVGANRWTEVHYGTGEWEGVTEESARVTILGVEAFNGTSLPRALAAVAHAYGQDAIALSIGTADLIAASATTAAA